MHPTFQEPDTQINDVALKLSRHDQLDTEASSVLQSPLVNISDAALDLTEDVQLTDTELVNRALARAHSDQAIEDAKT